MISRSDKSSFKSEETCTESGVTHIGAECQNKSGVKVIESGLRLGILKQLQGPWRRSSNPLEESVANAARKPSVKQS